MAKTKLKKKKKRVNNKSTGRDYTYDLKYQKSPKRVKYRSELRAYNRKHGTDGNGDGKDASHRNGVISGFEAQSKNRARK